MGLLNGCDILQMTSVERIMEYSALAPEAALDSSVENKPPKGWPDRGVIAAENVSMCYTQDGPTVLEDVSFSISAGEKVNTSRRTKRVEVPTEH